MLLYQIKVTLIIIIFWLLTTTVLETFFKFQFKIIQEISRQLKSPD